MEEEGIEGVPMKPGRKPERICLLRFHAFGDAVISLPVLAGLRQRYPEARIDFVTSEEYAPLFAPLPWIDQVHTLTIRTSRIGKFRSFLDLRIPRPDVVIDIQRSRLSALLRRRLAPEAWVAFDRYAPKSALERYLEVLPFVGLDRVAPDYSFPLPNHQRDDILRRFPLPDDGRPLICLNPAGCWPTKNWSTERYVELGERVVEEWNGRILLLGTEHVRNGARLINERLGENVLDFTGTTTPFEAMILLREADLIVSDDSGLMHLAWTNGLPTVGIFGSSRRTWSRPVGNHTRTFGSEDLSCGPCMRPDCVRGDLHCLDRLSVAEVMNLCRELYEQAPDRNGNSPLRTVGESTKE